MSFADAILNYTDPVIDFTDQFCSIHTQLDQFTRFLENKVDLSP